MIFNLQQQHLPCVIIAFVRMVIVVFNICDNTAGRVAHDGDGSCDGDGDAGDGSGNGDDAAGDGSGDGDGSVGGDRGEHNTAGRVTQGKSGFAVTPKVSNQPLPNPQKR